MTARPLHRNRDFVLLQTGLLLSSAGSQMTAIAYPLLVLALTGSAAKAGVVAFVRLLAMALFALPAGLAADRWDRRRLMIAAHAVRAVAIGALGVLVAARRGRLLGRTARRVRRRRRRCGLLGRPVGRVSRGRPDARSSRTAVAVVTGREAAVSVASPALGGVLFGIARALPFLVHAVLYVFSAVALLAMRTPFQEERERRPLAPCGRASPRGSASSGITRSCGRLALLFGLANFVGPGVMLAIVVIGEEQGLTSGEVGLLLSSFGACVLLGAFLSPLVRRRLPVRGVLLLELWTWVGCGALPRLAERLCADREHPPHGARDPVDRLRRPQLPAAR